MFCRTQFTLSTDFLMIDITSPGFSALKMPDPETIRFAPALAHASMVCVLTPPSTWIPIEGNFRRIFATFGIVHHMNDWPPKPGSTVITSTWLSLSQKGKTSSAGVSGLSAIPGFIPFSKIISIILPGSSTASKWKVNVSAPALAKSGSHCAGLDTMRWQSKHALVYFRTAAITGAPMVRFGTKWPSITSMCSQSAPNLIISWHSEPSLAKSEDRTLGQMAALMSPPTFLDSFDSFSAARIASVDLASLLALVKLFANSSGDIFPPVLLRMLWHDCFGASFASAIRSLWILFLSHLPVRRFRTSARRLSSSSKDLPTASRSAK
mmetsp:Transcript_5647/g.7520  ORF Transcript_5647/g.7520 Transcript_5647/m.7520 type:complete len:323 (+) Transcript_5647:266-1234(+)